jgi:predicted nucleic acid-binding protein
VGLNFVLDTNAVIYLQQGVFADPLPVGRYFVSVITEIELLSFPTLTPEQLDPLRALIDDLTVVPIDPGVKDAAVKLRRAHRLRVPDAIVAGTAVALDAVLLSNDAKLQTLPDLRCRSLALTANT